MLNGFEKRKIIEMAKSGKPRTEIAAKVGCTTATVRNILKPLGLIDHKRSIGGKKGIAIWRAKSEKSDIIDA